MKKKKRLKIAIILNSSVFVQGICTSCYLTLFMISWSTSVIKIDVVSLTQLKCFMIIYVTINQIQVKIKIKGIFPCQIEQTEKHKIKNKRDISFQFSNSNRT